MRRGWKTSLAGVTSALLLALVLFGWAAPANGGAALFRLVERGQGGAHVLLEKATYSVLSAAWPVQSRRPGRNEAAGRARTLPAPVSLRESEDRGLLIKAWINGAGPFTFAIDTGAGATLLSPDVAREARVEVEAGGRGIEIGGLSGARAGGARKAFVRAIALGSRENGLPVRGLFVVAHGLPSGVDGVLDPSEAFWPLGFCIDLPAGELSFFDSRARPLRATDAPRDGAVVSWLTEGGTRRPFVMLAEGRRALLDTGSGFGLAVDEAAARALGVVLTEGRQRGGVRDLAGGEVRARRLRPATVSIGPLVLRGVPTDLLLRAEKGAPVILGRDALRPFRLTFDPLSRLIMLEPRAE